MTISQNWRIRGAIVLGFLLTALLLWNVLKPSGLPEGIVSGNGRLEATQIDIASKSPGRIEDILVDQGEMVKKGEVVARMDTDVLQAQKSELTAQLKEARNAVLVARTQVQQRESELAAAQAVVRQREAELNASRQRFSRSRTLAAEGATAVQERDDDAARVEGAQAATEAARAQVASAEVGITNARNQVVGSLSRVEAVEATIRRIDSELSDSTLRAPRAGRVQYRVAEPGEVISGGGRVVNMVDLTDVSMAFFLPASEAGRLRIGSEARIVLDALPNRPIPAYISFVSDVAQFTPKTVETTSERAKMMFRVKAKIAPALLRRYISLVKTGLPGMVYTRTRSDAAWPEALRIRPIPAKADGSLE